MSDAATRAWIGARSGLRQQWDRLAVAEHGEGVISAAIAVLVMAFLGAAMWFAFQAIFSGASSDIAENVEQIGGGG
ncbi:MAG: hypothetical protein KY469_16680 [Actinobacteria bacterium]|nr:hypothetical protein [Actinomycetota bacterium]